MKKTVLEQFSLQKVKTKGNGLELKFEIEETTSAEVYHDEKTVKSDKVPHGDLTKILDVFKGHMAEIFYFGVLKELRDSNVFEVTANQAEILNTRYKDLVSKIKITGVSVSGKEENRGIIITATLKVETGHVVAINSQRIKFNGTKYGFEEDLENLITDLEGEVFEYVINGKQAQLEMAFGDDVVDGKMAAANDKDDDNEQLDLEEQANKMEEALGKDEEE